MSQINLPATMKAWQYLSAKGGIEKNMQIKSIALPQIKPNRHLIQTVATSLNPVDYKPVELPLVGRFLVSTPATPGIDVVGRIVVPAAGSSLKKGQLIFGMSDESPFVGGGLAEYVSVPDTCAIAVPKGVNAVDAATVGVAGLTAYQSIIPHVKKGDWVFLNGGSGGTGTFAIQIAKAAGCHVATTCSTANVELCESLGADKVIDYRKSDVLQELKKLGQKFDHVVDNIGANRELYWKCHEYTKPAAIYVQVGTAINLSSILFTLKAKVWPGFLGGGRRKHVGFFAKADTTDLTQIANWMATGEVKAVIDSSFSFEDAPEAYRRLKTSRAKGKIVVNVEPK